VRTVTPLREHIKAPRFYFHTLDSASVARGESGEVVEQEEADGLLIARDGLDIDERACQLEYVHKFN